MQRRVVSLYKQKAELEQSTENLLDLLLRSLSTEECEKLHETFITQDYIFEYEPATADAERCIVFRDCISSVVYDVLDLEFESQYAIIRSLYYNLTRIS